MNRRCRCELGGDCDKVTLCALTNLEEEKDAEIERLTEQRDWHQHESVLRDMAIDAQKEKIAKLRAEIERLRQDRLCRCADEVRCEMRAEIERLTKVIALNCDPANATEEDAKVIQDCYDAFCGE